MKTILALCSVVLLAACAVPGSAPTKEVTVNQPTPPRPAVQPVLDPACADLSKTARAIALLRDAGADKEDVPLMVKTAAFPLAPMIREVYARKDITPEAGATNSYTVCTNVGFDAMHAALVKADEAMTAAEVQRVKDELAIKKAAAKKPAKKDVKK